MTAEDLPPDAKARVITVSDRSHGGLRHDESGPLLESLLVELGFAGVDWLVRDYKMEPWAAHLLIGYQGQYDVVTVAGSMALRLPRSALPH